MRKVFIGIDTGASGAIAVITVNGDVVERAVYDMPQATNRQGKKIVDCHELRNIIQMYDQFDYADYDKLVAIEDVHAMPKQGATSMFNFGMAKGMIIGVVASCDVGYMLVAPHTWKRAVHIAGTAKDYARSLAIQTWPDLQDQLKRKKDIDRADALWIAEYLRLKRLGN